MHMGGVLHADARSGTGRVEEGVAIQVTGDGGDGARYQQRSPRNRIGRVQGGAVGELGTAAMLADTAREGNGTQGLLHG